MNEYRYPAEVYFSEEDEGFIALAPDLSGCSAFGDTADEALRELQLAIKVWIDAATKAGNPVPQPSPRKSDNLPSGKTLLRLPRTMHKALNEKSKSEGVSLNSCIVVLLSDALGREGMRLEMGAALHRYPHQDIARQLVRSITTDVYLAASESVPSSGQVLSREGSVAMLRRLPAGKPVIYMED